MIVRMHERKVSRDTEDYDDDTHIHKINPMPKKRTLFWDWSFAIASVALYSSYQKYM